MLRRAGLLGDDDAGRVESVCRERGVSPVVALDELGLTSEPQLLRFLHSKLLVPIVDGEVMARVEPATLARVPAAVAWRHTVLPISVDDTNNLTLAMADPTDLRAVEAVTAASRAYVIRAVASLALLRAALERHYGPPPMPIASATPLRPLSVEALAAVLPRLATAQDRDALTHAVLDFLADGFERVILFVHVHGQIRGREGRGRDLLAEAVGQVRIPAAGASIFSDVIARREPYFGRWPVVRPIDRAFAQAMGGIRGDTLMMPIRLRDRVPVMIFGMNPRAQLDPDALQGLSTAVSAALERMIAARKQA